MTEIRPLRLDDTRELAELHLGVWRAAYGGLVRPEGFDTVDLDERTERWRQTVRGEADPPRTAYVADDAGTLVGFVVVGVPRDDDVPAATGEVYAIYVAEERWGSEVGHRLLQAGRAHLVGEGLDRVCLWVLEDNPRARRFYERAGLSSDGTRKDVDLFGTVLPELRYAGPAAFADGPSGAHSSS